MNRRQLLLAAFVATFCLDAFAADETRNRLEAHVRFLADDLLEGRGSPSRGLDIAALYIAENLRASGWAPAKGESFQQPYALMSFSPAAAKYEVTLAGSPLRADEFLLLPFNVDPAKTPLRAPLVFLGWGIDDPEKGIDEFRGADIRGKAVVVLRGAAGPLDPSTPFGADKAVGKNIAVTARNGALTIYVSEELPQRNDPTPPSSEIAMISILSGIDLAFLRDFTDRTTSGIGPVLIITPAAFDRTLGAASGRTYAEWQKALASGRRSKSPSLKGNPSVEIRIDALVKSDLAFNIAGVLRGSDPQLRDEWVVLTAHYDHLGSAPVPAGQDGIYNGADDNASGTAALLEIARRLGQGPSPPRRSVLALFVSAEERGLIGSAYYSRHPIIPMSKVVADINVDMVGRSDGSVQAISHNSEALFQRAVELGKKRNLTVKPDQQPSWKIAYLTDSYHFSRFDVPAIEFFTGIHPDYHQPSDQADRIHYDEMGRIVDVIYELTRELAQGAARPAAKRPAWFLTPD